MFICDFAVIPKAASTDERVDNDDDDDDVDESMVLFLFF
jgi:hypothetical protein